MRGRLVRPGDSISDAMTARTWNELLVASDAINNGRLTPPRKTTVRDQELPSNLAAVHNTTSGVIGRGDVLGFTHPAILPSESSGDFHNRVILKGIAPTQHCFGIADSSIGIGDVGRIAVSGIVSCKLMVPSNGSWITRADADTTNSTRLLATPNGSAQILWKDAGTNQVVDAIVRLGCDQHIELPGKTVANVNINASGAVTIWQNGATTNYEVPDVHLDWMHNSQKVSAGKQVIIAWFPSERRWRFVGAECES